MKKIILVCAMLLIAVFAFGEITATSTTAYDADAETVAETIDTKVKLGSVSISNSFIFTQLLAEAEFDWKGAIDYAVNEAITLGATLSYGVDSEDNMPFTLSGSWQALSCLKLSAKYANDNLNADEVEIGTFTITASASF